MGGKRLAHPRACGDGEPQRHVHHVDIVALANGAPQ